VPLFATQRPDFVARGITGQDSEQTLPANIADLWRALRSLSQELRQQFFQVASLWQLSRSIVAEYPTAAFALMVAAVEALKPARQGFREHTIYHVVESLLGKETAELLNQDWFQAQKIRNAHFHWGEFRGSEFSERAMMSTYHDPTFDRAHRTLALIASAAIIEWLVRGGPSSIAPLKRKVSLRWLARGIIAATLIAAGLLLGWVIWSP